MGTFYKAAAFAIWLAMTALAAMPAPTNALPAGRAWVRVDTLVAPGFDYMSAPLLDIDEHGRMVMIGGARSSTGPDDTRGMVWRDSSWSDLWALGRGVGFRQPVLSSVDTKFLVWREATQASHLIFSRLAGHGPADPETVATIGTGTNLYAAAATNMRRWAIAPDFKNLRAFVSEATSSWREIETGFGGRFAAAVAAINETLAVVAWEEIDGMHWAVLSDDAFMHRGIVPGPPAPKVPRFRSRPSGGYWMTWGSYEPSLSIATFRDGQWIAHPPIPCAYRLSAHHLSENSDMSRDDGEFPVVAWGAQVLGRSVICVCVPSDSGFTTAEELVFAPDGVLPTVARDRNGDVWVAWWRFFDGIFWTHTYVTATARDLRVAGSGAARRVQWTLSEPAPETWWAVLRAQNDGAFEEVARIRATSDLHMAWEDPSPPAGVLRYRIRRESVDTRYEWLSEEARWPPGSRRPILTLASANPLGTEAEFEIRDAAEGPLTLRIYDVMGRVVARNDTAAGAAIVQRMRVALGAIPRTRAGVYFAVAEDAAGVSSAAVKLVVLE